MDTYSDGFENTWQREQEEFLQEAELYGLLYGDELDEGWDEVTYGWGMGE